jgi:hypothetical protein
MGLSGSVDVARRSLATPRCMILTIDLVSRIFGPRRLFGSAVLTLTRIFEFLELV